MHLVHVAVERADVRGLAGDVERLGGLALHAVGELERLDARLEPRELNGHPGAIFRDRDNKVLNIWTLDVLEGRIQTIRSVINPDKLGHLGRLADAWAVFREANQARRPTA